MGEGMISILCGSGAAAVVSGVTSIVLWYLNNKKSDNEQLDDITSGLQILLYDRIKYLGLKYIDNGEISSDNLEDLQRMHRIYHNELKGNGYLDTIMSRVNDLPIIH